MVMPDTQLASLIAAGAPASGVIEALRKEGFKSLADDAIEKVLAGATAIDEVLKVMIES